MVLVVERGEIEGVAYLGKAPSHGMDNGNSSWVIKHDHVGAGPDNGAILLVDTLVDELGFVGLDPEDALEVCEFCPEGTGDVSQTPVGSEELDGDKEWEEA